MGSTRGGFSSCARRASGAALHPGFSGRPFFLRLVGCLALATWAALPSQGMAQLLGEPTDRSTGIGWVGVLPEAPYGAGAFHLFAGTGWGLYLDGKFRRDARGRDRNFLRDETVASIEATYPIGRRLPGPEWEEWTILNAGVVRALGSGFRLVVGGGLARREVILEYFDGEPGESPISDSGIYYVRDERFGDWEANGAILGIIQIGNGIAISAGFETAPSSMSLGAFLLLW